MTDDEKIKLIEVLTRGGQTHVGNLIMDNHGTMNIYHRDTHQSQHEAAPAGTMPDVLNTEPARQLWQLVKAANFVDDNLQPLLTRTQAALLAAAMARKLELAEKWKPFEQLWQRQHMCSDYNRALSQQQSLAFQDKLKQLL